MLGGEALTNASNKNKSRVIGISIALAMSAGLICSVISLAKEPAPVADPAAAAGKAKSAKKGAPLSGADAVVPADPDGPPPMPDAIPPSEPLTVPEQKPQLAPNTDVVSVHAQITKDALGQTFSDSNLKSIIAANESQDVPGSEGAAEARRHFSANTLVSAVGYIDREKKRALNLASEADTDPRSRADALRHLGMLMHTVQDFYLRSNYLEMQLETQSNIEDPFNIPLVDWSKVPDGITTAGGLKLTGADPTSAEDVLVKDTAETPGGKKVISGKITQHAVAKDLALRETQRQWNVFETLLRTRCGDRAPAVLAALRQAGPEEVKTSASDSVK